MSICFTRPPAGARGLHHTYGIIQVVSVIAFPPISRGKFIKDGYSKVVLKESEATLDHTLTESYRGNTNTPTRRRITGCNKKLLTKLVGNVFKYPGIDRVGPAEANFDGTSCNALSRTLGHRHVAKLGTRSLYLSLDYSEGYLGFVPTILKILHTSSHCMNMSYTM